MSNASDYFFAATAAGSSVNAAAAAAALLASAGNPTPPTFQTSQANSFQNPFASFLMSPSSFLPNNPLAAAAAAAAACLQNGSTNPFLATYLAAANHQQQIQQPQLPLQFGNNSAKTAESVELCAKQLKMVLDQRDANQLLLKEEEEVTEHATTSNRKRPHNHHLHSHQQQQPRSATFSIEHILNGGKQ